jgi:CheY-like chemotaxis protein
MARILLVDDNPPLLATAGRVLREAGHQVTSTNNGADAICLLRHKPSPDLLILDVIMPGGGGKLVIDALGPSAPPVIIMSGDGEAIKTNIDMSKVCRVLLKPFDLDKLMKTVEECLATNGVDR